MSLLIRVGETLRIRAHQWDEFGASVSAGGTLINPLKRYQLTDHGGHSPLTEKGLRAVDPGTNEV